ncbi:hypothetical protein D3C73_173000 [compost metagenome]|jgi:hypothetical protein
MKASLESLLANSLSGVTQPVATNTDDQGPVEGLSLITSEQIAADVTEHMKDERYKDADFLSESCRDFLEQNEMEHAELRGSINDIKEMVGGTMASMEMLATIASMESIDDTALVAANTAIGNINSQYGIGEEAPVLVSADNVITTASMEGLVDWVKKALLSIKKWIVEKFQNMAINQRRVSVNRQSLLERAEAVQKRMSSIGEDYGIPVKQMRYNPKALFAMYRDGAFVPFEQTTMSAAIKEASDLMKFANENLYKDAITRSDAIGDVIADVLVARDEIAAEEKMRAIFKTVTQPLPIDTYFASANIREREVVGGMTFMDPSKQYRTNYRDAEWIMELVRLVDMNQAFVKYRQVGSVPSTVYDMPVLHTVLDAVGTILDDAGLTDMTYYDELASAWAQANKVYNRLYTMIVSMEFPHMNNELWRALDVGCTAMFMFLDKAYYHTLTLRSPMYRYADGLLYVLEEQMKAYVAVNR